MDTTSNLDEQQVSLPGAAGETESPSSATVLENLNSNIESSCSNNNNNNSSSANELNKNNNNSDSDNNNNNNNNDNHRNDGTSIKDYNNSNNLIAVINENCENILNENQENCREDNNEINQKILFESNPAPTEVNLDDSDQDKLVASDTSAIVDSIQIHFDTVDSVITEAAAAVAAIEPIKSTTTSNTADSGGGSGTEQHRPIVFLSLNSIEEVDEENDIDKVGDNPDVCDEHDKPPVPLPTYCWEELKRAKEQGGYPWTHLYKGPLAPYDEPEIVIGLLTTPRVKKRVKQRLLSNGGGSPKTEKKLIIFHDNSKITDIRCDESSRQIDELDLNWDPLDFLDSEQTDTHDHVAGNGGLEDEVVEQFKENFIVNQATIETITTTTTTTTKTPKNSPFNSLKQIKQFKKPPKPNLQCCKPLVDKLKVMADKHFHSHKPSTSPSGSGAKKKPLSIKKVHLSEDVHIPLKEEQKILRLKESPRAGGREISSYVERQDSDDVLDIVHLEESPQTTKKSKKEKKKSSNGATQVPKSDALVQYIPLKPPKSEEDDDEEDVENWHETIHEEEEEPKIESHVETNVVTETEPPNSEIIAEKDEEQEPSISEIIAEEMKNDPPQKAPRKKKEHVYEDIDDYIPNVEITTAHTPSPASLIDDNHESIKASLNKQDKQILHEIHSKSAADTYLDDINNEIDKFDLNPKTTSGPAFLAPISSIDSTSSDEDKRAVLPTLSEENSDNETVIENIVTREEPMHYDQNEPIDIIEVENGEDDKEIVEIFKNRSILSEKSSLTRSPGSEKKVTFSQSTEEIGDSETENEHQQRLQQITIDELKIDATTVDESHAEGHDDGRDSVDDNSQSVLPTNGIKTDNRWSNMGDHEYEPVGEPVLDAQKQQNGKFNNESENGAVDGSSHNNNGDTVQKRRLSDASITTPHERKLLRVPTEDDGDENLSAQELQKQIEDRFFSNVPSSATRTENEGHTSQVDSSANENYPLKREDRKRSSMMTSIQDTGRNMQTKLRNQAGKVRTKLRGSAKQSNVPTVKIDSPVKVKERKKFKAPDFSKLKSINMPKFKKPDFKFPDFKKTITTQEITTTTPDNHKFVTVIEQETILQNEPQTFEVQTTTVESPQQSAVVITLPVDIPPPIEVPPPVPTQEKKSRFSRPEMPKFNFSDKFASLRSIKKEKSVVIDDDVEEPKDDSDKPADAKKSRFSRPEKPKFNLADKFSSLRPRRSRSKSAERSDRPPSPPPPIPKLEPTPVLVLEDDEQLDFTEQKVQLTANSPPADGATSAPPVLELREAPPLTVESTTSSASLPSTELIAEPEKKSRFTRPEFTRFNFSEKLASFRRSRSSDATQNKAKDAEFEDDDDDESIPPEKVTTKKRFSKPELPKFKIQEKFSSLRLRRSKSFKETSPTSFATNETTIGSDDPISSDEQRSNEPKAVATKKPLFNFDFGTYPRFLSKLKKQKTTEPTIDSKVKVEFPTMSRNAVRRMSFDKDNESGSYHAFNENEDIDRAFREGSVEKRMRLNEVEAQERYQQEFSDEQRQLDDYDRENREIHEIAKSRYDPPVEPEPEVLQPAQNHHGQQKLERQESDWNSEDEKVLQWVKQKTMNDKDFDREDSDIHSDELDEFLKYSREQPDKQREVTPYTNQETQSSGGSSGMLRGKGVIEEIDDDEFYLRKKGISQENIPINEYISSALREGLADPINTLAQVGDYNAFYPNINTPSDKFNRSMESDEIEPHINQQTIDNYFGTFPPNKPIRRQKKSYSIDSQEIEDQQVPRQYYPTDETRGFYENDDDEEDQAEMQNKTDTNIVFESHQYNINLPPVAPKRRKRNKISITDNHENPEPNQQAGDIEEVIDRISVHEVCTKKYVPPPRWAVGPSPVFDEDQIIVHQTHHEYHVPMAEVESFKSSPHPVPRSRSRSHITDDDRTSRGAESISSDNMIPIDEPMCKISSDPRDAHGYAIIKKNTAPPRPPAPLRRKTSTQSLTIESKFSTMPMSKHEYVPSTPPPSRPNRNYSTIIPSKPPRRKSVNSLNDSQRIINASRSSPDLTQYEELDDDLDDSLHRDLHSGDVINKMKHRPLPPPPRPPRTLKKSKKKPQSPFNTDKFDHDDGDGGKVLAIAEPDVRKPKRDTPIEEIDMSTQTDAIEGEEDINFVDDFEIELDELEPEIKSPNEPRTLQEILEKEQEAELERARQLAEAKHLDRGIQRFRESSQRNFSERSRASSIADHPKTSSGSVHISRSTSRPSSRPGSRPGSIHGSVHGSRPITPSAILIEKRTATPQFDHGIPITDVKLTVQPLDLDDDIEDNEAIMDNVDSPKIEAEIAIDDEKEINLEVTIEKQEMDKFRGSDEILITSGDDDDEVVNRNKDVEESSPPLEPSEMPVAPPRRKSSTLDTADTTKDEPDKNNELDKLAPIDEQTIVSQQHIDIPPTGGPVERLQVTELDVNRLNVNALHANQIIVSELQSMTINTQDIECRSGNLAMRTIELPPGFIDEIVDRLSSQLHQHQQQLLEQQQQQQQQQIHYEQQQPESTTHEEPEIVTESSLRENSPVLPEELPPPVPPPPSGIQQIQDNDDDDEFDKTTEEQQQAIDKSETHAQDQETPPPPARPPPPDQSHFYQEYFPYSIPPPSFYQLRNPSDEEPCQQQQLQTQQQHSTHVTKPRHRRHQRKHDSTSEEEYQQREPSSRNSRGGRHGTRSPEPSIPELGGQILRACSTAVQRSCRQILTALRDGTTKEVENNNEFHVAIIIVIIIVAGLILFGMGQGNKTVHLHHWDYFNPPGSGSEQTQ